jgi:hypothetical protein
MQPRTQFKQRKQPWLDLDGVVRGAAVNGRYFRMRAVNRELILEFFNQIEGCQDCIAIRRVSRVVRICAASAEKRRRRGAPGASRLVAAASVTPRAASSNARAALRPRRKSRRELGLSSGMDAL